MSKPGERGGANVEEVRSMNIRVVAALIGIVTVLFGALGLAYPERIMGTLGLATASEAARSAVLGEIRAVYGGLFLVLGLWTVYAAWQSAHSRLLLSLLGSSWIGIAGGRALWAWIEGNPGLWSWTFFAFEVLCGGGLLAAAFAPGRDSEDWLAAGASGTPASLSPAPGAESGEQHSGGSPSP